MSGAVKLKELLHKECVIPNLKGKTKHDIIKEMSECVARVYPFLDIQKISTLLLEREKLCSTAIDRGVALPHTKVAGLSRIICAFGRSIKGVDFDSLDEKPSHLFLLILSPQNLSGLHLHILARASKILKQSQIRSELLQAKSKEELYNILIKEDEKLR